jgi:hypothetical protein
MTEMMMEGKPGEQTDGGGRGADEREVASSRVPACVVIGNNEVRRHGRMLSRDVYGVIDGVTG